MKLNLRAHHFLMATGLLPLLYMTVFQVPKYILGFGIGTYPLIVISFIAGMQYQRTSNTALQIIAMLYPVIFSFLVLVYGDACFYYVYALVFGLLVDYLMFFAKRLDTTYLVVRSFLVLVFSSMLFALSGVSLYSIAPTYL